VGKGRIGRDKRGGKGVGKKREERRGGRSGRKGGKRVRKKKG